MDQFGNLLNPDDGRNIVQPPGGAWQNNGNVQQGGPDAQVGPGAQGGQDRQGPPQGAQGPQGGPNPNAQQQWQQQLQQQMQQLQQQNYRNPPQLRNEDLEFPATRDATRGEVDFMKVAPKFYWGQVSWEVYINTFRSVAQRFRVSKVTYKNVLYNSLHGEAKTVACPDYDPARPEMAQLNGIEYGDRLRELYEPAAESQMMQLAFAARSKAPNEHVTTYLQFKLLMFLQAYKQDEGRPWTLFYEEACKGLTNATVRMHMRRHTPNPLHDHRQFRAELLREVSAIQRAYLAREIGEAEVLGCEHRPVLRSYEGAVSNDMMPNIKQERVNAIGKKTRTERKDECFHCGGKGHYIAQCPRKMAGMDRAVAISEIQGTPGNECDQEEGADKETGEETPRVQALDKYPKRSGQKLRFKPKSKRTVQVVEGENGELYLDQEDGEELEAKINTLTMEDGLPDLYQEPDSEDDEITEGLYDPIHFLEM